MEYCFFSLLIIHLLITKRKVTYLSSNQPDHPKT